jgi:rhodanese-related sulfurtransferase
VSVFVVGTSNSPDSAGVDNVGVRETWERLRQDPSAVLVDVRTEAEWNFVGIPDLSPIGRKAHLVEWQSYPSGQVDKDFAAKCEAALASVGAGKTTEVFFLCRSGARSLSAARAMSAAGFIRCHNVKEGFEGPLDGNRQRRAEGWKAAGLPWLQG